MLDSIRIEKLRGIREGTVDGLSRVSVLVGPNGCGKSTVLDAMLIGAAVEVGVGLSTVWSKRRGSRLRWLVHRLGEDLAFKVVANDQRTTNVIVRNPGTLGVTVRHVGGGEDMSWQPGSGQAIGNRDTAPTRRARLLPGFGAEAPSPLVEVLSTHISTGTRTAVEGVLRELVPDLVRLEMLKEANELLVHMVFSTHSVPVELAGDGMSVVVRAALELPLVADGLVLIEEPETHQHPASMRLLAQLFFAAARRGVQLVISTHSIEFIDMLADAANGDDELNWLTVHRLKLDDGLLSVSRIPGPDVAFARTVIHDDLR